MSYAVLTKELKTLPEEYLDEVAKYVDLLKLKIASLSQIENKKNKLTPGLAEGKYTISEDPNFGDDIVTSAFEDYL